ncbi:hypothetical protein KFK14_11405 [Sphingobium phenoxybenzoativorans]|uniref:Uncharacterized protein n=1 Tax=Sphingobium phenoxybenzoativorans TaxID=1592790 RepID=A0A975KAR7_9SPHN|nr:hypothetical protein [Sphingobium phenoxybenzoativorans]QUT07935.1 hypothetical protein KFK14_11405 [Sphingobium phenoxybenzoativorans]
MAKSGRKRKQGKRTKSGQLVRTPRYDKGCDGVIRRRAEFGIYAETKDGERILVDATQTFDALGRAWSAGLLGEPDQANRFRDTGRVIAAQYWRTYGFATPDSLARFQPSQGVGVSDSEKEKVREKALNASLDRIKKMGPQVASAFSQLVIDLNPDKGPPWLDRIIYGKRTGKPVDDRDTTILGHALDALSEVA